LSCISITIRAKADIDVLVRTTRLYAKQMMHKGVWVEPTPLPEIENQAAPREGSASVLQRGCARTCESRRRLVAEFF
jgi:hypothetical protein